MAIVTFWNNGEREVGQTVSIAAIATYLSLNSNYKVMIFNTKYQDSSISDCFWNRQGTKFGFKEQGKTDIDTGASGLVKAIMSNKTSPEIITNYTKTIFKNKLELLTDKEGVEISDYNKQKALYKEIIKMANKYYDIVLVDVSGNIDDGFISNIVESSNIIVATLSQSLRGLDEYSMLRREREILNNNKKMVLLGRYDKKSTFNIKNIERTIGEKVIYSIPYNTLFFENSNQGLVDEYFIKLRKIKQTDPNYVFIDSVREVSEKIVEKIKELQQV